MRPDINIDETFENPDEDIHQRIVAGLLRSGLNTTHVYPSVMNGVVYLRGEVFGPEDLVKIEDFAKSLKGVLNVRNELAIRD